MSPSSRSRPEPRAAPRLLVGLAALLVGLAGVAGLVGPAALQWHPAGAAEAVDMDVLAVLKPAAGQEVSLVTDVRPPPAAPLPAGAFAVTAGDRRLPTSAVPMMSDALAMAVVIDASAAAGETLQSTVNGAAGFLLQTPAGARVAAVAATDPPAVLATAAGGAKEALRALTGLRPAGKRSTDAALDLALDQLPSRAGQPRLVLLATGAADAGGPPPQAVAERLSRAGATLAVVRTGAGDSSYWAQVTSATGGLLAAAADEPAVGDAFDRIGDSLRGRYLLTFPRPERLPAEVAVRLDTAAGPLAAAASVPATPAGAGDGASGGGGGWPVLAVVGVLVPLFAALLWLGRRAAAGRTAPASGVPAEAAPAEVVPAQAVPAPGPTLARTRPPPGPAAAPEPADPAEQEPGTHPAPAGRAERVARSGPEEDAGGDAVRYAHLDGLVGDTAAAVAEERTDVPHAVARIGLAAAGRPDLLDRIAETERRFGGSRLSAWPPTRLVLDLVARSRPVASGEAALLGPAGLRVRVEQAPCAEGGGRSVLRLTRDGEPVGDCASMGELARQVDPATLLADDPAS